MNDLISRQAALEMLNDNELKRQADDVFDGNLHRYKRAAQRIIAQLPSAVKHGKWEVDFNMSMSCSVCLWCFEHYGGLEEEWNYCPHCGARMNL